MPDTGDLIARMTSEFEVVLDRLDAAERRVSELEAQLHEFHSAPRSVLARVLDRLGSRR